MKKILLVISTLLFNSITSAQEWRIENGEETLDGVRARFHNYADRELKKEQLRRKAESSARRGLPGNAIEQFGEDKVKGFKQFKRLEYLWENRVLEDGTFPAADHTYNEYLRLKNENHRTSAFSPANWSHLGPNTVPSYGGGAGRVNCIAFHPANNNLIWVGTPAGGLWKSTDGGNTWSSNTDLLPNLGISDIAIDHQNPQIMYIATGDADGGDTRSIGVLKSIDAGLTWNTTGLTYQPINGRYIYKLLVDPVNPNILLAATSNGIYRSTNAGTNWALTRSGATKDLKFKPGNSSIVYALAGSTMIRSLNNGVNWATSNTGLPTSGIGRVVIAVTPADTNTIYALISKPGSGTGDDYEYHSLYRSFDGGSSWSMQSNSPNLLGWSVNGTDDGGQSWYDLALTVSETNADLVFVGGVNLWRSTNGGVSWTISAHWYGANGKPYVHADCHQLKFVPNSGNTLYACVDGGLFKSTTSGTSWTDKSNGLQIMQFYKIGGSATNPDRVLGGAQDNGTNMMYNSSWDRVIGGDGMECLVDHTNDQVMFGELYYGDIEKSIDGGQTFYSVKPEGSNDGDWVTPYIMDPNDNNIMYLGLDEIYKSYDNGESWEPVTNSLSGGVNYKALAVAKSNSSYVYASTGSSVFKSTDAGLTWSNITSGLSLGGLRVTYLNVKPSDENTLYLTLSAYSATSKVFRTTDAGATWTNITSTGLPNTPANCIEVENNNMTGLYVGTDLGVYYRNDTMSTWVPFNDGLPNVIVNELEINYASSKLRAGTYGRGLWETDLFTSVITSAEKDMDSGGFNFYPNPVNDQLIIENINFSGDLEITSETGQVVYKSTITEGQVRIDVSMLSAGIYFLNITNGSKVYRNKLVVN